MVDTNASTAEAAASKRVTRTEEVGTERRRRAAGSLDRGAHFKLAVPEQIRDDNPGQQFRWVNDTGNRMHQLTVQDDYSVVDGIDPVPVGTSDDGKPIYARLCKKPMEYWLADQKEKSEAVNEKERGLLASARTDPNDTRSAAVSYVPAGNSIK